MGERVMKWDGGEVGGGPRPPFGQEVERGLGCLDRCRQAGRQAASMYACMHAVGSRHTARPSWPSPPRCTPDPTPGPAHSLNCTATVLASRGVSSAVTWLKKGADSLLRALSFSPSAVGGVGWGRGRGRGCVQAPGRGAR